MKNRILQASMLAIFMAFTLFMGTSCSDDDDDKNPSMKVSVTDINGTSATISWNLVSEMAFAHDVEVINSTTGTTEFSGTAGIDLSNNEVETSIEATGLTALTEYVVKVVALSILDEELGSGNTTLTTTEKGADEGNGSGDGSSNFSEANIVGRWETSNMYYVFNEDKSGEYGQPSDMFGDEKLDNITWEVTAITIEEYNLTTGELTEREVTGVRATDSEGYYSDFEPLTNADGILTLVDHDNNDIYTKVGGDDGNGDGSTGEIVGINFSVDNMGSMVKWTAFEGAKSYMVQINGTNDSDLPISSNAYMLSSLNSGDVVKVQAFSDSQTTDLIAEGSATYSNGGSGGDEDAMFDAYVMVPGNNIEAENFISGGEGVAYHDIDDINEGNSDYRIGGVDVSTLGSGDNYNVGWTVQDEWLVYNINVIDGGQHHLVVNTAGGESAGGSIRVYIDGIVVLDEMQLPATGSWNDYIEANSGTITLTAGEHALKIEVLSNGSDYDYFKIEAGLGDDSSGDDSFTNEDFKDSFWTDDNDGWKVTLNDDLSATIKLYDNDYGDWNWDVQEVDGVVSIVLTQAGSNDMNLEIIDIDHIMLGVNELHRASDGGGDDGGDDSSSFVLFPSSWETTDANGITDKINIVSADIVDFYGAYGTSSEMRVEWTVTFDENSKSGNFYEGGNDVGGFTISEDGKSMDFWNDDWTKLFKK